MAHSRAASAVAHDRARVTILHASDLHFGKLHRPEAAEALLRLADEADPDAVVVSGDFTQRAKKREYLAARRFLDRLRPRPLVVTPGNHDVPLYRAWERIGAPYRNYRRYIADPLDSVLDVRGAVQLGADPAAVQATAPPGARQPTRARFVALNSTSPLSAVVNGRLGASQLDFAAKAFSQAGQGTLRVLVVHHNLLQPEDGESVPSLPAARRILRAANRWGVRVVLSGHVHRAHFGWGAGVPVVTAGTASSWRGRRPEERRNTVNLVRVSESNLEVNVYLYCENTRWFTPRGANEGNA